MVYVVLGAENKLYPGSRGACGGIDQGGTSYHLVVHFNTAKNN